MTGRKELELEFETIKKELEANNSALEIYEKHEKFFNQLGIKYHILNLAELEWGIEEL